MTNGGWCNIYFLKKEIDQYNHKLQGLFSKNKAQFIKQTAHIKKTTFLVFKQIVHTGFYTILLQGYTVMNMYGVEMKRVDLAIFLTRS